MSSLPTFDLLPLRQTVLFPDRVLRAVELPPEYTERNTGHAPLHFVRRKCHTSDINANTVTSGRQLKRTRGGTVPTPRLVYCIILPTW